MISYFFPRGFSARKVNIKVMPEYKVLLITKMIFNLVICLVIHSKQKESKHCFLFFRLTVLQFRGRLFFHVCGLCFSGSRFGTAI